MSLKTSDPIAYSDQATRANYWKEEAVKWEKLCIKYKKEAEDLRTKLDDLKVKYNELLNVDGATTKRSPSSLGTSNEHNQPVSIGSVGSSGSGELAMSPTNSTEKKKKKWNIIKFLDKKQPSSNALPIASLKKELSMSSTSINTSSSSLSSVVNNNNNDDDSQLSNGFTYDERELSTHYHHLPKLLVKPLKQKSSSYVRFSGPDCPTPTEANTVAGAARELYQVTYGDSVHALSTSTYPSPIGSKGRDGDPIADRYNVVIYENRLIACLADGCNWGLRPQEAAKKASEAFIEYCISKSESIQDVKQVGKILFDAFESAHHSILKGKDDLWEAGTTTLLGGLLLEINKGDDKWSPEWEFVLASVGDCKAYLITDGEVSDITEGNRVSLDAKDCGGRLGPHLDEGKPDLRNLNVFCASVNQGDIILLVTDGVHDNLDPSHLGKTPADMSKEFNLSGAKWADVDLSKAVQAKTAFTTNFLETMLQGITSPSEITHKLINHCWDTTQTSRNFMETMSGKRLPQDFVKYPGKMDHTTCICFRVGQFDILNDDGSKSSSSTASSVMPSPQSSTPYSSPSISSPHSNNNNNNSHHPQPHKDWVKTKVSVHHPIISPFLKKEFSLDSMASPNDTSSQISTPNSSPREDQ
ncbi:hypothetical protein SAMD00019534_011050 [Acytostelium subglobosum LB1]|uniref:hypothetical protein n=1 Tax=Acytostelium subglobosum LB1 TaxID=1410327 RepID=UPI0006448284|nr:hypothetical protein SAMD00019534_011050 [Acytostelium subglobosum LB1]GAM17930.1 hypothetical protein SAMD00019534_011050 [Acytostelium subglobosum LB1]|eukprot:XP_012758526.1 hypothetical protein SAMD00019534_011050 [Acytostelium subglobosum LB1]